MHTSLPTETQAPRIVVPDDLVQRLEEQTGVTVCFFDASGTPAEPGVSPALQGLVREALDAGEDRVLSVPDGLAGAWLVRQRGRPTLVAGALLAGLGPAGERLGRRLLGAVSEAIRTRFAQAELAGQCESLSGALSQSFEELSLLHNVGEVLRVTRPVISLMQYVCEELCATTGAEASVAYLPGVSGGRPTLVTAGVLPVPTSDLPRLFDHVLEVAPESILVNNQCRADPLLGRFSLTLEQLVAVPLMLGEGPTGTLALFNRPREEFGSPDAKLLRSSANATAVFVENRRLYDELQAMMLDLVRALVSSVDAKDPYTCGHSERVATTCRELAVELGLPDEQVERTYMAGLLHDIGKIGTPEAILCKEGYLQPEEREIINQHPVIGGNILKGIRQLEAVRHAVVHHHERLDGSGYPDGLTENAIPFLARIVGLADAFDAMTSNRPYRPTMPLHEVLAEIDRHAGTQFDTGVVEAFRRIDKKHLMEHYAASADTTPTDPLRR